MLVVQLQELVEAGPLILAVEDHRSPLAGDTPEEARRFVVVGVARAFAKRYA
jgi:hypothetical protein